MEDILDYIVLPFSAFSEYNSRINWIYLWFSFVLAVISSIYNRRNGSIADSSIIKFIFPKKVYFHRSAINDYIFFYTNFLFQTAFILPLFSTLNIVVSSLVNECLLVNVQDFQGLFVIDSRAQGVAVTFVLLLVADFSLFFTHYLQHKIPWLWEFHKVHHSAEVLTPMTVFRMHPVDNILTYAFSGLVLGLISGIFIFLSSNQVNYFNINGVNIFYIFFYFLGYNLRHSHIWIDYGRVMSHVFISPAQHQIHHSSSPDHFNKNMGFMFSFWDGLFGTLYIPKFKQKIEFGINDQETTKFASFWSLYFLPFVNLIRSFQISMVKDPKRFLSVLVFFIIVIPAIWFNSSKSSLQEIKKNIYLQDMTWKEVNNSLQNGFSTVLVPTGGTEQNGPHMILGKHNYIVEYTAGRIAEKLGKVLVAPVISYVPEGSIFPPEGHMKYSGTISVTNDSFRAVLEAAARSLKQHGFKTIAFIGDSGGNQADQAFVADKLTNIWQSEHIKVIHVSDYYYSNHQVNYLMNSGFSSAQIGGHAGIRDTSELMAILPNGVREELRKNYIDADFNLVGADGDASKASALLGKHLLDLKINSAVIQIKKILQ